MEYNQNILLNFLNKIDPFDMIKYGEHNIYMKEVKLILNVNQINSGKIKDIFYIGYKQYISDEKASEILSFLYEKNII